MVFKIENSDVLRCIMRYYREKSWYDSMITLALQANVGIMEDSIGEEILYLQKLILEGRWDDLLKYVKVFDKSGLYSTIEFLVKKQQFLELLSWIGCGGHLCYAIPLSSTAKNANIPYPSPLITKSTRLSVTDDALATATAMEVAVDLLKELEPLSPSKKDFDSLCFCLTLENITDNPDYQAWSVGFGRVDVVDTVFPLVKNIIIQTSVPAPRAVADETRRFKDVKCYNGAAAHADYKSQLMHMFAMGLAFQCGGKDSSELQISSYFDGLLIVDMGLAAVPSAEFICSDEKDAIKTEDIPTNKPDTTQAVLDMTVAPNLKHKPAVSWTVQSGNVNDESVISMKDSAVIGGTAWDIDSEEMSLAALRKQKSSSDKRSSGHKSPGRANGGESSKHTSEPELSNSSAKKHLNSFFDDDDDDDLHSLGSQTNLSIRNSKNVVDSEVLKLDVFSNVLFECGTPVRCVSVIPFPLNFPTRKHENALLKGVDIYDEGVIDSDDDSVNCSHSHSMTIAIGCNDKSVRVLRCSANSTIRGEKAEIVAEYNDLHKGSVYCSDVFAYGHNRHDGIIATGSNDKCVRLTRLSDGEGLYQLRQHTGTIRSVKFNRENPLHLASAGAGDCKPRIWDVNTGQCVSIIKGHEKTVHGLSFATAESCGHNVVLSGDEAGLLNVTDTRCGTFWNLNICPSGICSLDHVDGSNLLLAGCNSGVVALVDLAGQRVLKSFKSHADDVRSAFVLCDFSSNISNTDWCNPPKSLKSLWRLAKRNQDVILLTTSFDHSASLWRSRISMDYSFSNLCNLGVAGSRDQGIAHSDKILCASFDYRFGNIVTSGADGKIIRWNINCQQL